jgi:antitoxin ParD1/3/4
MGRRLKCKKKSYILNVRNILTFAEVVMARTMTVDLGSELRNYVESLVDSGDYKSNSEVLRESLRLLREKQAESKLVALRHLIDEGEASGDLLTWNAHEFLKEMKKKHAK